MATVLHAAPEDDTTRQTITTATHTCDRFRAPENIKNELDHAFELEVYHGAHFQTK